MKKKKTAYNKMLLQSPEEIYAAVHCNIPDKYTFNKNTTVMIFNCINETTNLMTLTDEQTGLINQVHSLCHGTVLYDFYKEKAT